MSSTHTSPEPSPDELAHGAHEAAGHADDGRDAGHGSDDHIGETLGPVDVRAWGALIVGVGAGLVVALCLMITTALVGSTPAA